MTSAVTFMADLAFHRLTTSMVASVEKEVYKTMEEISLRTKIRFNAMLQMIQEYIATTTKKFHSTPS